MLYYSLVLFGVLSPTFLIRLQWAQWYLCNMFVLPLFFLLLLSLLHSCPLATTNANVTNSFSFLFHHLVVFVFVSPYPIYSPWWFAAHIELFSVWCSNSVLVATCWDVLYMDMNLFAWYSIYIFFLFVSFFSFFSYSPILCVFSFFLCPLVCYSY